MVMCIADGEKWSGNKGQWSADETGRNGEKGGWSRWRWRKGEGESIEGMIWSLSLAGVGRFEFHPSS